MKTPLPNGAPSNTLPGLFGPPSDARLPADVVPLLAQILRSLPPETRAAVDAMASTTDGRGAAKPVERTRTKSMPGFNGELPGSLRYNARAGTGQIEVSVRGRTVSLTAPGDAAPDPATYVKGMLLFEQVIEGLRDALIEMPTMAVRANRTLSQVCGVMGKDVDCLRPTRASLDETPKTERTRRSARRDMAD